MVIFGRRTILGLAIDELGVLATELEIRAGRPQVRRVGEFLWAQEFRPENVRALGERFHQFLRDRHFSSRQAVVGLASKWALAKEITVPPASADALAGLLSIQAERAFSLNAEEMVFDYCGRAGASDKSQVLLVAARRQFVEQIREFLRTAGLQARSITVSALALGAASSELGQEHGCGLYMRPTYCEFWNQWNGRPQSIQYVPLASKEGTSDDYAPVLVAAIRRLILLSSRHDSSGPCPLTTYDACGFPEEVVGSLQERLAPAIAVVPGVTRLPAPPDRPLEARSVAATAVALSAVPPGGPGVDFLNPKIGVRKVSHRQRVVVWAAILGVAFPVALGALVADWRRDTLDVAAYTQQLEQMSDDITAAREIVDRVSYASSWTSRQPQFLECLRALTEAFPQEPRIWATSLALNENGRGALVGKTDREDSFYGVLDKIRQDKAFSDVKMVHIRDAGRDSQEKEFAVNFQFQRAK